MPNAIPPPSSDADKVKLESAVSSAAASPAPSVASSKDDRIKPTLKSSGGGGADVKDTPELSVDDSTDADMADVEKRPSLEETGPEEQSSEALPAAEDMEKDLSEKLEKELKKEEAAEEGDAKDDSKDNIGDVS